MARQDMDSDSREVNFDTMCRACALSFDAAVLRDITPPIREMLVFSVGIEVDLLSELPTHMCGTCYARADAASQFKLQCQRAEQTLRSLVRRKQHMVASTPHHDGFCSQEIGSPKSITSALEAPLTPIGCDTALSEILERAGGATPNLDDNISMTNFINAILEDNRTRPLPDNSAKTERDHIINPDSVLSFLDYKDGDSKTNMDDSYSLITNFSTPRRESEYIKKDSPHTVCFDKDTNIIHLNNDSTEVIDVDLKKLEDDVNSSHVPAKINNVTCDTEIEAQDTNKKVVEKVLRVIVADFKKFAMPEKILKEELKDMGYIRCRYCYRSFTKDTRLYKHMIKSHPVDLSECRDSVDYVRTSFPEEELKEELQTAGKVRCRFCTNRYRSAALLYNHIKIKHNDRCDIKYRTSVYQVYMCDHCNRAFTLKTNLRRHLEIHEKTKRSNWQCDVCGRMFRALRSYQKHVDSHAVKQYGLDRQREKLRHLCTQCGKTYTTVFNLNQHIKRHSAEKKFQCTVCDKAFTVLRDLNNHMRIHEKMYKCDLCGKNFSRSDQLTLHKRKHAGEHTYHCAECGIYFMWRKQLKVHVETDHKSYAKEE